MTDSKHWTSSLSQEDRNARAARMRAGIDTWANRAMKVAIATSDKITGELPFPSGPTNLAGIAEWKRSIHRVVLSALADELVLPQGDRNFQRLTKRWEDYRLYLHEKTCPETTAGGGACIICGIGMATA